MKSGKSGIKNTEMRLAKALSAFLCVASIMTARLQTYAQEESAFAAADVSIEAAAGSATEDSTAILAAEEVAAETAAGGGITGGAAADAAEADGAASEETLLMQAPEAELLYDSTDTPAAAGARDFLDASNAKEAWEYSRGEGITVAVIDSGINADHEDLAGAVDGALNVIPEKQYGDNGLFADSPIAAYGSQDNVGHGTHLAGIIAARDNETGVTGIAPESKVLSVKFMDYYRGSGAGTLSWMTQAVRLAIENGAKVINCSFGTSSEISENTSGGADFMAAVNEANNAGIPFVCAAGNAGKSVMYPAALPLENIISVSAYGVTDEGVKIYKTYTDPENVTISAPGIKVNSTWKDGEYNTQTGTSMAAAVVSGSIADLLSYAGQNNVVLSCKEIITLLQDSADKPEQDDTAASFGAGMLNAGNMLELFKVRYLTETGGDSKEDEVIIVIAKDPASESNDSGQPGQQDAGAAAAYPVEETQETASPKVFLTEEECDALAKQIAEAVIAAAAAGKTGEGDVLLFAQDGSGSGNSPLQVIIVSPDSTIADPAGMAGIAGSLVDPAAYADGRYLVIGMPELTGKGMEHCAAEEAAMTAAFGEHYVSLRKWIQDEQQSGQTPDSAQVQPEGTVQLQTSDTMPGMPDGILPDGFVSPDGETLLPQGQSAVCRIIYSYMIKKKDTDKIQVVMH